MATSTHVHTQDDSTDIFGFWLYILTDCVLFASLFATFIVLNKPMAFGPKFSSLVNLDFVLIETFVLLASNFCFGLAALAFKQSRIQRTQLWLGITFLLGAAFVAMELYEFVELTHKGYTYTLSGASASFYTLVGTHGFHVLCGLLWIAVMMVQLSYPKLKNDVGRRLVYLGLFWNFLDVVWVFLFSIVYLVGALQ
jgi:cytochrome o ubiquinol oxidase subunit 3